MPSARSALRLALAADGWTQVLPAAPGERVRLGFRHSVYGGAVEEEFRMEARGLRLTALRYAESRIAEFYGHDGARRVGDWWVAAGDGSLHATLSLRVSADSAMSLSTEACTIRLTDHVRAGDAVRLTVMSDRE